MLPEPKILPVIGFILSFIVVIFVLMYIIDLIPREEMVAPDEKIAIEIGENILTSELTVSRAIFSKAELEKLEPTYVNAFFPYTIYDLTEPYVRHCRFAYRAEISCTNKDICDEYNIEEKYIFGYEKPVFTDHITRRFSAAITDGNVVVPAMLHLTVFGDRFSLTSCLIERAYKYKEVQETSCSSSFNCEEAKVFAWNAIYEDDTLCTPDCEKGFHQADPTKRYLPGIEMNNFEIHGQGQEFKTLKALPIRSTAATQFIGKVLCSEMNNYESLLAGETDDVVVVLCVE